MALIKELETETGIITNYHNIGFIELNKTDGYLRVRVCSYLSEEKRNEGKKCVGFEYFDIPQEEWQQVYSDGGNITEAIYNYLLTLDKFNGAISDV